MSTLVIAEIGACHDGSMEQALELVQVAKDCGADCVKAQYWSDSRRLAARRHAPELAETYHRYAVPVYWLNRMHDKAQDVGIRFMCTAYLPEDVPVIAPLVAHFKVASFEAAAADLILAHRPYVDADIIAKRDRLVIVSRGLGDPGDVLAEHLDHGTRGRYVRHLLCTSAYPAPTDQLGLRRLRDEFDGFSDHSSEDCAWTGALAVAAGAGIVERHVKLNRTKHDNPDFSHAMFPRDFASYVGNVRFAEACVGPTRTNGVQQSEVPLLRYKVTGDA